MSRLCFLLVACGIYLLELHPHDVVVEAEDTSQPIANEASPLQVKDEATAHQPVVNEVLPSQVKNEATASQPVVNEALASQVKDEATAHQPVVNEVLPSQVKDEATAHQPVVNEVLPSQVKDEATANQPVVIEFLPTPDLPEQRTIRIQGDNFTLNGKPLQIISGSIHYFRMPSDYWRDRLKKLKAAGFNAVSTYVEWSYHEPERRQYRFKGDYDVELFVRLVAEEGLMLLLRPGPYICAERDLGGLPYWLLHEYPNIKLRTTDKDFIEETRVWFETLFEKLTPLLYENGGPIILVQVENEYGLYGNDISYKTQLRDIIQQHVNSKALLYTTDTFQSSSIQGGAVPGVLSTIDFGYGQNIVEMFKPLRSLMPNGPLMNSEFYISWLTHWGESWLPVDKNQIVSSLKVIIDNKINVNMYMFFGGTNFEFSSGANKNGYYMPHITSYDYDAPLNEAGDPTPKYYAIRKLMETYEPNLKNTILPKPEPKGAYGKIKLWLQVNLLSTEGRSWLGKPYNKVTGPLLPTFEQLGQRAGLVLYETTLTEGKGLLKIYKPHDRVYVYINGEFKGVISRISNRTELYLELSKPESEQSKQENEQSKKENEQSKQEKKQSKRETEQSNQEKEQLEQANEQSKQEKEQSEQEKEQPKQENEQPKQENEQPKQENEIPRQENEISNQDNILSLLVESLGRINHGPIHDFKGILSDVKFNESSLNGTWDVIGYPLESLTSEVMPSNTSSQPATIDGAMVYEGTFVLPKGNPLDTFIDPTGWTKGYIWVNGHNLGRYWPGRGPQITLYLPGVWLHPHPAENIIQILELERASDNPELDLIDHPKFTDTIQTSEQLKDQQIFNRTASQARLLLLSRKRVNPKSDDPTTASVPKPGALSKNKAAFASNQFDIIHFIVITVTLSNIMSNIKI